MKNTNTQAKASARQNLREYTCSHHYDVATGKCVECGKQFSYATAEKNASHPTWGNDGQDEARASAFIEGQRFAQAQRDELARKLEQAEATQAELLAACKTADLIAADLACFSDINAEGRRVQACGEKLHKIIRAAIAKVEGSKR